MKKKLEIGVLIETNKDLVDNLSNSKNITGIKEIVSNDNKLKL